MNFEEYEQGVLFTWANAYPRSSVENLATVSLGLCGEAGEFADTVKKLYAHGHPVTEATMDKLKKELGDAMYYVAVGAWALGISMEEIAIMNREKLMERYPNGFEAARSINRTK